MIFSIFIKYTHTVLLSVFLLSTSGMYAAASSSSSAACSPNVLSLQDAIANLDSPDPIVRIHTIKQDILLTKEINENKNIDRKKLSQAVITNINNPNDGIKTSALGLCHIFVQKQAINPTDYATLWDAVMQGLSNPYTRVCNVASHLCKILIFTGKITNFKSLYQTISNNSTSPNLNIQTTAFQLFEFVKQISSSMQPS